MECPGEPSLAEGSPPEVLRTSEMPRGGRPGAPREPVFGGIQFSGPDPEIRAAATTLTFFVAEQRFRRIREALAHRLAEPPE